MTTRLVLIPLAVGVLTAGGAFAVTSALVDDDPARSSNVPSSRNGPHQPDVQRAGAAVFARMGCGSCHALAAAGSTGAFGPSLDERLPAHSASSLRTAILSPPTNSMMPADFRDRLSPADLDALVSFLLRKGSGPERSHPASPDPATKR